jgi:hypothetical protein
MNSADYVSLKPSTFQELQSLAASTRKADRRGGLRRNERSAPLEPVDLFANHIQTLNDRTGDASALADEEGVHHCQIYLLGAEDSQDIEDLDSPDEPEFDEDARKDIPTCGKPAELYLVRSKHGSRTLQFMCDDHALRIMAWSGTQKTEVVPVRSLQSGASADILKAKAIQEETPMTPTFGSKTDFSAPDAAPQMTGSEVNSEPNCFQIPTVTPSQDAPLGHSNIPVPGNGGGDAVIR